MAGIVGKIKTPGRTEYPRGIISRIFVLAGMLLFLILFVFLALKIKHMKKIYLVAVILVSYLVNSCIPIVDKEPSITSPIILSNRQHHVGDNEGAEGLSLHAEFEMPTTFRYAEMDVTFVYPDEHGTSGPDVETPPEITINGYKVGIFSDDFKQFPECITTDGEFHCSVTFTINITDELKSGTNVFSITSMAFFDNFDDFTISDVVIRFE